MFPSVIGSILLAYNLDGVKDGELKLSREAVAGIFMGRITKWNNKAIVVQNPDWISFLDLDHIEL